MKLPILTKLVKVTAETTIEAIQKETWTAFINNVFDFGNVAFNYKSLISEFQEVEHNPQLLEQLQDAVKDHPKFKQHGEDKAVQVFEIVWQMIVFNAKGALAIKNVIEE